MANQQKRPTRCLRNPLDVNDNCRTNTNTTGTRELSLITRKIKQIACENHFENKFDGTLLINQISFIVIEATLTNGGRLLEKMPATK